MRLIDADILKLVFEKNVVSADIFNSLIDAQPTVDAEPVRHGKWMKKRGAINCSACKSSSWSMSFGGLVTSFNYCPNCGAKMDGEQEKQNDKLGH